MTQEEFSALFREAEADVASKITEEAMLSRIRARMSEAGKITPDVMLNLAFGEARIYTKELLFAVLSRLFVEKSR